MLTLIALHISKQAAPKDSHKHLDLAGLFARRVDPQLGSGIVDDQLILRCILHTHGQVAHALITTRGNPELDQAVSIGMGVR